jgi:hypothetical protein
MPGFRECRNNLANPPCVRAYLMPGALQERFLRHIVQRGNLLVRRRLVFRSCRQGASVANNLRHSVAPAVILRELEVRRSII